jgi:hypothetical protein
LPDCLAARLSGTLSEVEAVVRAAEQAPSLEVLCMQHRFDIELPGALRWVRRRVRYVQGALDRIKGLSGEPFERAAVEVKSLHSAAWKTTTTSPPLKRVSSSPWT